MKTARSAVLSVVVLGALNLLAQSAPQKSYELVKYLAGKWEGKNQMGDPLQVSFRITASGSAVMSEIVSQMQGKQEDMISMIHMDGDRLLLTHYCAAGNQPRMQVTLSPDGKSIRFDFVDATNLVSLETPHMRSVVFTFVDANHHIEEWHFQAPGKEIVERFDLQKKG
ncbi:MAG TPA: hypothetical protein VF133_19880 [Terriglobales bacterium]